jgi:hypothetical protein
MNSRTCVLVRLVRAVVRIKNRTSQNLVRAVRCVYIETPHALTKAHQETFLARVIFLGRSHQAQTALVSVTQGRKVSHVHGL